MNRETVIPLLSVVAGILCAIGIASVIRTNQTADDVASREKFESLPPSEQRQLLQKAASFEDSLTREDRDHLQAIHTAVQADPKLANKLENFREWYQSLSDSQRRRIRETRQEDWVAGVVDIYLETQTESHIIHVPQKFFNSRKDGEEQTFSEEQFIQFLDTVLTDNNVDLTEKLKGFDDSQVCEETLVKVFEFFDLMRSKSGDADFWKNTNSTYNNLIVSSGEDRPDEGVFWAFRAGMIHFAMQFNRKYRDGQIVDTFEEKDRDQQIEILQMDSRDAEHTLRGQLMMNRFSKDSEEYRLLKRINEAFRSRFVPFRNRGHSGGRSGFGGGSGQGGREGRGPRGQKGGPGSPGGQKVEPGGREGAGLGGGGGQRGIPGPGRFRSSEFGLERE